MGFTPYYVEEAEHVRTSGMKLAIEQCMHLCVPGAVVVE